MPYQQVAVFIRNQCRIINGCAIGDHADDSAIPPHGIEPRPSPFQSLAIDILMEQTRAKRLAQMPWRFARTIGRPINNMPDVA